MPCLVHNENCNCDEITVLSHPSPSSRQHLHDLFFYDADLFFCKLSCTVGYRLHTCLFRENEYYTDAAFVPV